MVGRRAASVIRSWAPHRERTVVCDFNGTLSNDEPILLRVYTDMFSDRLGWRLSADDYFSRFVGRSDREIIEMAIADAAGDPALVTGMLVERCERYRDLVAERSPIEPSTVALVRLLEAHGVPMAIVTGAPRSDVELVVTHSGLAAAFDVIITEEDVAHGKPHPEGYELAATRLGVEPGTALVFEDSIPGIHAARAAGMRCIGVVGTKTRRELEQEADAVIDELTPALFGDALAASTGRR